ncbi:MAG: hypothetical protein K2N11_01200 [Mucispirillum sp.]|nr:hypothetical protein [Mucispirillum sp.]
MSNSENNYYLKDGLLYKLTGASMYRVSSDDVMGDSSKSALLIDDSYFFYVGMENISTSAKKLHAVAANYLNMFFPADMIREYGVFQHSGKTIIYVINQTLIDIISENAEIFTGFKKISTPFLEQCIKYNEFIFSDGSKKYRLSENIVSLIEDNNADAVTAKDLFETMQTVKYSMLLPGIVKKSAMKLPFAAPAALLGIIYIVMIIGSISEIAAYNKVNKYYEEALSKVYNNLGVASSKDPYGSLLQQSKSVTAAGTSERVLTILNNLNDAGIDGIMFDNINIRDDDIRVSGTATSFAQVDEIKRIMENKIHSAVNVDDTKKTKDGISFTMKYTKTQR